MNVERKEHFNGLYQPLPAGRLALLSQRKVPCMPRKEKRVPKSRASEVSQFLGFMKIFIPALLFVVGMMNVREAIAAIREFFTPTVTWEGRVKDVGLSEAGDLVALVASNSAVKFFRQSNTWTYRGKKITAACDYELEYRFDLTQAKVEVVDPDEKKIRITLPAASIKCAIQDLRILQAEGGESLIGKYEIRPDQLNKVIDSAKEMAVQSVSKNKTNIRMAKQSIKGTLATLFSGAGIRRENIEFVFQEPAGDQQTVSYNDDQLKENVKDGLKVTPEEEE